jgi:DNA-binding transcriptional ArsR family regulator
VKRDPVETCAPTAHDDARRRARAPNVAVDRAATLFRALGDASRIRLLELLLDGEHCVGDLAVDTTAPMSTVSQQLRLLRAEGIVARRRAGKHVYYAFADESVAAWLRAALSGPRAEPAASPAAPKSAGPGARSRAR